MSDSFTVYFAGELFSLKHLAGNAILAEAIETQSAGRYRCIVPQDLEQRETTPTAIRNQDLLQVLSCDLGVYHFDGPELDSGTVVEFMTAKFLDIPAVIVRTDFRLGGDSKSDPWNLMASGYPRTETVLADSIAEYQKHLAGGKVSPVEAALRASHDLAAKITAALDRVKADPALLTGETRNTVYSWMRRFPGSGFDAGLSSEQLAQLLQSKISRGLL